MAGIKQLNLYIDNNMEVSREKSYTLIFINSNDEINKLTHYLRES